MPTYLELQQQIVELQRQAEEVRRVEVTQAIADIKAKMALYGITFQDLEDKHSKVSRKAAPSVAKYRDPVSGKEWTGRGTKPTWLAEALAAGKSLTDFLIENA